MITKRELDAITGDSRREARMAEYIANNGGQFVFNKHNGWGYRPEKVINNQLEKLDRRAEKKESAVKSKAKAKEKKSFLKLRK